MKCKICGASHEKSTHPHYKLVDSLNDKGFPRDKNDYLEAHKMANKKEKSAYGKRPFKQLERIDDKLSKHELAGKNLKTGKLEVSKRVPKKLRSEVAYHEEVENKILRKRK